MSRFSRIYSVRAQATPLAVLIRTYVGSSAGLQFLGHPAMTQKWPVVSDTPSWHRRALRAYFGISMQFADSRKPTGWF